MITYKSYIQLALKNGNTISVYDGGEWAVKRSHTYKDIVAAIDSVGESEIIIRDGAGNKLGWALIVLGNRGEEDIADYSDNEFMNALYNTWQAA